MSDGLPKAPAGWEPFVRTYGDESHAHGAKKWFGDHYKEVVVDALGGDLHGACLAIEQEMELRAQGAVNEAHRAADELEAAAKAVRPDAKRTDSPVKHKPAPQTAPHETVPPVEPVEVASDAEVHAESRKKTDAAKAKTAAKKKVEIVDKNAAS